MAPSVHAPHAEVGHSHDAALPGHGHQEPDVSSVIHHDGHENIDLQGLQPSSGTQPPDAPLAVLLLCVLFVLAPSRQLGIAITVDPSFTRSVAKSLRPPLRGPLLTILGACLACCIDNNLTRKVSLTDASWIAAVKGLVAGSINLVLAFSMGAALPGIGKVGGAMLVGFLSYGVSLALFVVALRHLGTARTGAYFSIAPFFGALLALLLGEPMTASLVIAGSLMAVGIWLHLNEHHEHLHSHDPIEHEHDHVHNAHHQHAHDVLDAVGKRHGHRHRHEALTHSHAHYPDAHHDHEHD